VGGEYMHDFTWEDHVPDLHGAVHGEQRGTVTHDVIQSMIADVNDVGTWNLAPLSAVTTQYIRNVAMTASPYSRPAGNNGFTEYAPRHVVAWWAQDDWKATSKLTLNLGVRYDANIGEFVNWVEFKPFLEANRPNDLNNIAPRLGFNYAWNDKTVIRGGYGIYFGEATGQPPLFTLRYVPADRDDRRQRRPCRFRGEPVQRSSTDLRPGEGVAVRISAEPRIADVQPPAQHAELRGAGPGRSVQPPGVARFSRASSEARCRLKWTGSIRGTVRS
jgi:hypothetical protein